MSSQLCLCQFVCVVWIQYFYVSPLICEVFSMTFFTSILFFVVKYGLTFCELSIDVYGHI